ncbi:alpha-1,3-mannosyltransferase alg-2 [Histoplasma capsulatum G186AR]|uniref:Alpha-1,3/1,6-mannosyltransferase ALG2 n=2 Tax=Ajellomyces capsulatus TaxID=5037 RepID=C0NT33_AJECG|nr:alpha-1,3-mannosyltransferase alg-2 [Histoplasma capsulatum G186AR]EEH05194.1 alpha-1,3-mannosyltransferase alg-2 [Histoplasma capsulatum G186AR]KAG5305441.1 alpha-1,3-mannosyltransferase alg-2 [Histoplasma capsulatum]QSS76403.1 alpha-1,3-mannosyltransferase alg-2 [Histoplasma capsulatum G186AR]
MSKHAPRKKRRTITILHPDLGIGGAERLILDIALALQARGHKVKIYTSHRDRSHCFEEARDDTLDVTVRGNTVFPDQIAGRFRVLFAVLRQVHLVVWLLMARERERGREGDAVGRRDRNEVGDDDDEKEEEEEDVYIVDQVPACVPILKTFGRLFSKARGKQRILFYCHFPDQLLAKRDEGGVMRQLIKACYRYPFDWFEGWAISAADKVVANSKFTCGVIRQVFGDRFGDVRVVYPCVDTGIKDLGKLVEGKSLWGGKKILLSINRFERKKDIGLAIRAYHGLGEEGRHGTRLVIAGGYDNRVQENVQYHTELDDLATGLGLRTATSKTVISALSIPDSIEVLFLLSVPSAFKQTLLSAATLLVYTPSYEHFGIVPVEAMRVGLPVLAVNNGGPLETIIEGKTGWLRGANAIEEWTAVMRKALWEMDAHEAAVIGANGKERVEKEFSLQAMGDRLAAEIEDMFDKDARPFLGLWSVFLFGVAILGLVIAVLVAAFTKLRIK